MLGVGLGLTTLRGRAAGFSPLDIPNLAGWWDASDTSTITESGGSVSQWDDKSGNGLHVTQAVSAEQPSTGLATQNSLNVLSLDGSQYLKNASPNLDSDLTIVCVFKVVSATNFTMPGPVFGSGNAGRPAEYYDHPSLGRRTNIDTTSATLLGVKFRTESFNFASWLLTYAKDTAASPRVAEYSNNVQTFAVDNATAHNVTGQEFFIGRRADGTTTLNGQIGEVLVFDRIISSGERADLASYLAGKWGL